MPTGLFQEHTMAKASGNKPAVEDMLALAALIILGIAIVLIVGAAIHG